MFLQCECLPSKIETKVDEIGNTVTDSGEIVIDQGEKYVAVFDTLGGSSSVDAGIPTGTIIGVSQISNVERFKNFVPHDPADASNTILTVITTFRFPLFLFPQCIF